MPESSASLLGGPVAILHSDLHEGNVLDDDGVLTVIDSGRPSSGRSHGTSPRSASSWTGDRGRGRRPCATMPGARDAARIGLAFGAYRWHLSREHAFDDDEHDRAYLETCLTRIGAAAG